MKIRISRTRRYEDYHGYEPDETLYFDAYLIVTWWPFSVRIMKESWRF